MKTITLPRRVMRPHPGADSMVKACAWCNRPIGRGEVFTRGKDMGKDAIVCGECLTPPALGESPDELSTEE